MTDHNFITYLVIIASILAVWGLIVLALWLAGRKYKNKGVK